MARTFRAVMLVSILLAANGAGGDQVVRQRIPYHDVKIISIKDCKIVFRALRGTRTLQFPLKEVGLIEIEGQATFNNAEKLLKAGKYVQAAAMYDMAERDASSSLLKRLIRYRRLKALDAAGQVDRAAKDWLVVMDENASSKSAATLAPTRLAPKGDKRNARAIALLEARLKTARGKKNEKLAAAIGKLLQSLKQRQGRVAGSVPSTSVGAGKGNGKPAATTKTAGVWSLKSAAVVIDDPKATPSKLVEVLKDIRMNLGRYKDAQLPEALLLAGKAQWRLANVVASTKQERELLLKSGLNCMRVAALYPDSDEAPPALLLAGRVNVALGNVQAARNAYEQVVRRYGGTPSAQKARKALGRAGAGDK